MTKIAGCLIDQARVTTVSISYNSEEIAAEVAFLAGSRAAGVLTVSGLGVNPEIASLAKQLQTAIERSVAEVYGTSEDGGSTRNDLLPALGKL